MSRKLAREIAFKVVFSNNFQSTEGITSDLIHELVETLAKDVEFINAENEDNLSTEDRKYIDEISMGVMQKTEELDDKIKTYLKGWTMDRIGKTDLAILRLAVYEILYREDIPYKVSINEAVELAKRFCDDTSPSFINGVLAALIHSLSESQEGETKDSEV